MSHEKLKLIIDVKSSHLHSNAVPPEITYIRQDVCTYSAWYKQIVLHFLPMLLCPGFHLKKSRYSLSQKGNWWDVQN